MIDNFSLGLTHVLMLYAAWKLLFRRDLDDESGVEPSKGWGRKPRDDA
jgi:hypothetical protein